MFIIILCSFIIIIITAYHSRHSYVMACYITKTDWQLSWIYEIICMYCIVIVHSSYFTVITWVIPRESKNRTFYSRRNLAKYKPIITVLSPAESSDSLMKWSLKIPLHLKRVATLPDETLVFKNCSNFHVRLQFLSREL